MNDARIKRFLVVSTVIIILLSTGISYFYAKTGSLSESFWITSTLVSTLGMADEDNFTKADKIFSSAFVLLSVIFFTFLVAIVSEVVFSGQKELKSCG